MATTPEQIEVVAGVLKLFPKWSGHTLAEYRAAFMETVDASTDVASNDFTLTYKTVVELFCTENFLGSVSDVERLQLAPIFAVLELDETDTKFMHRKLSMDGEPLNACTELPMALVIADCILEAAAAKLRAAGEGASVLEELFLWRFRVAFLFQRCLIHASHTLFQRLTDFMDVLIASSDPLVHVEIGLAMAFYSRCEDAASRFFHAAKVSGLTTKEDTMVGVRTKYQEQERAQMVLTAASTRTVAPIDAEAHPHPADMPQLVTSETGGHLLKRPRTRLSRNDNDYIDSDGLAPLHPDDKAIILALCLNIRNTNPCHGLTVHHMQTYIERLLVDPGEHVFTVDAQTLLIKSRLEAGRNQVQERSFLQMQELVDQLEDNKRNTDRVDLRRRFHPRYFFALNVPTRWSLVSEFGHRCFDENLTKTALEYFEKVLDWENIIMCCKKLDRRKKAESLARDLLEKDPENPMLWVALGEAARDEDHLWKAWELGEKKMAAPMRALAKLATERKQYDKVVEYFDIAVSINPIFGGDWFSLGFACMKTERWQRALEAFTRVCQGDPENAYAWNNLGSVFLRVGRMRPAFNAISQALKKNRFNWRMWDNYFSIGAELCEGKECVHALNVMIDIAGRNLEVDSKTLRRFTKVIVGATTGNPMVPRPDDDSLEGASWLRHAPRATASGAGVEEEEDAAELTGLCPLWGDLEDQPAIIHKQDHKDLEAEANSNVRVIEQLKKRTAEMLQKLTEIFVTNPDIYACCAEYFGAHDGPKIEQEFRIKELRNAMQVPQWERVEGPFDRVVEALEGLVACAVRIDDDAYPVKNALNSVDSVLDSAEQHFEGQERYAKVEKLKKELSVALKSVRAKSKET